MSVDYRYRLSPISLYMAPSLPRFIGTSLLLFYYSFMPLHREANLLLDSREKSFFFDHCISLWQFSIMIFTKKAEICFQINWDFYLMGQMVQSFSEETVGGGSEFIETTRQTFISSHFHLNTKQISPYYTLPHSWLGRLLPVV